MWWCVATAQQKGKKMQRERGMVHLVGMQKGLGGNWWTGGVGALFARRSKTIEIVSGGLLLLPLRM